MKTILESNADQLPTYDIDLLGATGSIFRLQDTYELTAREISDGKIRGDNYLYNLLSVRMEIGVLLFPLKPESNAECR